LGIQLAHSRGRDCPTPQRANFVGKYDVIIHLEAFQEHIVMTPSVWGLFLENTISEISPSFCERLRVNMLGWSLYLSENKSYLTIYTNLSHKSAPVKLIFFIASLKIYLKDVHTSEN
jgi:hypothetical protein